MVDDLDRVAVALVRRRCGAHPTDPSRAPTLTNVTVPHVIAARLVTAQIGRAAKFPLMERAGRLMTDQKTVHDVTYDLLRYFGLDDGFR